MRIKCTIAGVTPLLMHRFGEDAAEGASSGHRPMGSGDRGTPREQAEKTAYRTNAGDLFIPGPNVFAVIVEAGKFHKLGKSKVTTQKASLVPAGLMIDEIAIPLGTKEFEVDSRRVRMPSTGGSVMRHRARLDEWKLTFTINLDEEVFTPKFVRQLVDDGGKRVGLGDYRPATRGPFGRFVVTEWSEER